MRVLDTERDLYEKDTEASIFYCERVCYIDEENPDTSFSEISQFALWDRADKQKTAFLKFNLNPLKQRKLRRVYLRLVNGSGHEWDATATITVARAAKPWTLQSCWSTLGGRDQWQEPAASGVGDRMAGRVSETVFRVPEWQPTWFIDVTETVLQWMEDEAENYGFCLKGGIENQPLYIKCNSPYAGLNPMLVVVCSDGVRGNGALTKDQKVQNAFEALSQIYIARDISWSGSFVRNAQAHADGMGWGFEYRKALKAYFDLCITEDGKFRNVSEEYFYVSSCGQALIHLYQATGEPKYRAALKTLRDGLLRLPRSGEGIITAGGRVEVELIFCVCAFLAFYHDAFGDVESRDTATEQAIGIYDLMSAGQSDGIPLQNLHRPNSKGWSRGMGWIMAGMGKLISSPGIQAHPRFCDLAEKFRKLSETLKPYRTRRGMWRSILQDSGRPEEVTGSALIALGYEYGAQQGILDEDYFKCVDQTLEGILKYTRTGIDMGNCFPMNFHEIYEVTDFSGNSDQGYGTWMELLLVVQNR